jgi:hypothetical protein
MRSFIVILSCYYLVTLIYRPANFVIYHELYDLSFCSAGLLKTYLVYVTKH